VTPKSDESQTSGTLPAPELNPLLNPTLNENLGRWAEVYFTNPPEKRDEAVLNLLRELESGATTAEIARRHQLKTKRKRKNSAANANAVTCPECGFENEDHQRFCGDCGALLFGPAASLSAADPLTLKTERARTEESDGNSVRRELTEPSVPQFGSILHLTDPGPRQMMGASRDSGRPGLLSGEYVESTPLKRSYRVYIGAALALIFAGLGYVAWRGGQFAVEPSLLPAPAPPAASQAANSSTPPASSAVSARKITSTAVPAATTAAPTTTTPTKTAMSNTSMSDTPGMSTARPLRGQAAPVQAQKAPANSGNPVDLTGNGSQELAFAQNLLNGAGKERDSATAAQWLWKAVEKQNTAATVLLGGLYLRGDGVQKNCEQGHVLLDAAAVKGNKEAATLLRNLQAFGCQ
jgi:hypothetical protein